MASLLPGRTTTAPRRAAAASRPQPVRRIVVRVRAEEERFPKASALAPAQPKTAYGEMLQYYLRMEPHLFKTAVEDELTKLRAERDAGSSQDEQPSSSGGITDLSLYTLSRRKEEIRESERRATLEDLMYVSILEKFLLLGVDMLPRLDGYVDPPSINLKALTEGVHSKEALDLVKEHLLQIMGPVATTYTSAYVKMSKFQMAQVYAASVMFGYFLRRVDKRFQLERSLGTLPLSKEDAVARLERLFAAAKDVDAADNPDYAEAPVVELDSPVASTSSSSSPSSSSNAGGGSDEPPSSVPARKGKSALRRYVESFDQATMVETARIVSVEGAALVERQTSGLLGDIKRLTSQMQEAVGENASSMQEAMDRMAQAVADDVVETVTMSVQTQRRAVLEAVAFGTFLRDVEDWVHTDWHLLTPLPPPQLPPKA